MFEVEIPDYRAKSRNETLTGHWGKYKNARDEVWGLMIGYAEGAELINPAKVTITAFYKGRRPVDTSNIDDKLFIDGLQHLGVLKDDTPAENPIVVKKAYFNKGENKVIVRVEKHDEPI